MTKSNYSRIIDQNLAALSSRDLAERSQAMGADLQGQSLTFKAFGGRCCVAPDGIAINDELQDGPLGIVLSLYALNAAPDPIQLLPFKAFKEFPDSMPYVGAFASHTEQILVPSVDQVLRRQEQVLEAMDGEPAPAEVGGDSAMVVRPLPKIALCYIFYEADEDFPPSVTCLYSNNARRFMPMDGLADVGEYTSRALLKII
jgi:hypothetical protein